MCGLIAIIDSSGKPVNPQELSRARDVASHRGPDSDGIWLYNNIGLGHRRLAIVAPGDKGNQPFQYRHVTLILNGEIYNYPELREELKKQGCLFSTQTDTEVLAAAYCHWGTDCVAHFNGIWAFVLYDAEKRQVFCSRDRFGVKPLYYTEINGKLCLASEIKQFTAIAGWKPAMNEPRCQLWLHTGWQDLDRETLFEGVFQLLPGHNLVFETTSNSYTIQRYYNLRDEIDANPRLSFEDAKAMFRHLFFDAVRLQLRCDVKAGMTLSGGLDSSVLAAAMAEHYHHTLSKKGRLEAFSALFQEKGFNEEPYLNEVVRRHSLLSHTVRPDVDSFLDTLKTVTWHLDEPAPNPTEITHFKVFEYARTQGIKVNLCGQGADEILSGYDAFYPVYWRSLLRSQPLTALLEMVSFAQKHPATLQKQIRQKWQRSKGKAGLPTDFTPALPPCHTMLDYSIQAIESTVLPYILHSEDRLSMAHGIESRVPFLDHRLVEFCLSLPDGLKIRHGVRKYLLREAFRDELPEQVYRRYDKIGFETPFSPALKQQLELVSQRMAGQEKPTVLEKWQGRTVLEQWRGVAFWGWWRVFVKV